MKRKKFTAWSNLMMQVFLFDWWHGFWSWVAIEKQIKREERSSTTIKEE